MSTAPSTTTIAPVNSIGFTFDKASSFRKEKQYYAVFFHTQFNLTAPFDTKTNRTTVPIIETRGTTLVVIADENGAPTLEVWLLDQRY